MMDSSFSLLSSPSQPQERACDETDHQQHGNTAGILPREGDTDSFYACGTRDFIDHPLWTSYRLAYDLCTDTAAFHDKELDCSDLDKEHPHDTLIWNRLLDEHKEYMQVCELFTINTTATSPCVLLLFTPFFIIGQLRCVVVGVVRCFASSARVFSCFVLFSVLCSLHSAEESERTAHHAQWTRV